MSKKKKQISKKSAKATEKKLIKKKITVKNSKKKVVTKTSKNTSLTKTTKIHKTLTSKASSAKIQKPVTKAQKPASKAQKPVSKAQKPVSKAQKPASKAQKPVTKAQKPVSKAQSDSKKSKPTKWSLRECEKELQKIIVKEKEEKMILKDMKGHIYCLAETCDYPALVEGYCRIHFFGFYKTITKRKEILETDFLTQNLSELLKQHSQTILECLLKNLKSDKSFKLALKKLSIEEGDENEDSED